MTNDKTVTMSRELIEAVAKEMDRLGYGHHEHHAESILHAIQSAAPVAERQPVACEHEWTDDGEFLLVCTVCGAQEDHNPGWRDMASAPRDGTMLRLLVEFEEHATEDADEAPTIGANNFDNDENDEWMFAGWCWTHDHWVQGKGTPVGWLPMIDAEQPAPVAVLAEVEELLNDMLKDDDQTAYWFAQRITACLDKVKELNQ